jgi:hypothetical protein
MGDFKMSRLSNISYERTVCELSLNLISTYELTAHSIIEGITKYRVNILKKTGVKPKVIGYFELYKFDTSLCPKKTLKSLGGKFEALSRVLDDDWQFTKKAQNIYKENTDQDINLFCFNIKVLHTIYLEKEYRKIYDLKFLLNRTIEMLNFSGYLIANIEPEFEQEIINVEVATLKIQEYCSKLDFIAITDKKDKSVLMVKELDYE